MALPQASKRQAAGSQNVGQGNGQQFITGECLSAADCASGCCVDQGNGSAQCKARIVTEQAGGSCDFGGAAAGGAGDVEVEAGTGAANATEGEVDGGAGAGNGTETDNGGDTADNGACGAIAETSGSQNVGLGNGSQFITGQCFSAADCASGCCADQGDGSAQCKARIVTEQAGGSCDFSCAAA